MRLTVLGGGGIWPQPGRPCGGYVVEHEGFVLVIDPGYATVPEMLRRIEAERVDAVLITHGHPDHCADLNPLLRARVLPLTGVAPLPVFAPPGAIHAVIALDWDGVDLSAAYRHHPLRPPDATRIGPFAVATQELAHFVPNVGVRLETEGAALAYSGDSGPHHALETLARDVDVLLAEATYADAVPERHRGNLSSATDVARIATQAGAHRLVLTHLWPRADPAVAASAASEHFVGPVQVARPGLEVHV
jgi:ribonuclease BN (tRNA processing enzyme)